MIALIKTRDHGDGLVNFGHFHTPQNLRTLLSSTQPLI